MFPPEGLCRKEAGGKRKTEASAFANPPKAVTTAISQVGKVDPVPAQA